MQISTGKVVLFDYTLRDDAQNLVDTSEGREPLGYIHGNGQIVPGLEKALQGKQTGDTLKVDVSVEEGYGERDEAKIVKIERKQIQGVKDLEVGTRLQANGAQGIQIVTVVALDEKTVTIDANHPMAGQGLHFDITIREVRDATTEERDHGHVHGHGGHHH